jgi:hypothetical protein
MIRFVTHRVLFELLSADDRAGARQQEPGCPEAEKTFSPRHYPGIFGVIQILGAA